MDVTAAEIIAGAPTERRDAERGFLSALLAKGAASVMNRFLQSHAWHH